MNKQEKAMFAEMQEMIKKLQAQVDAQAQAQSKGGRKNAPKVDFVKKDGTTVQVSQAQADAWTKWRDNAPERKDTRDKALADWKVQASAYKPSKALTDAIRKDRASITFAIAKEKYGFVGTKATLKSLKDSICK